VVVDDHGNDPISERISRSGFVYHSRMLSREVLVVLSSIDLQLVITVVASEVRLRLVALVVDRDRSVSECRQYSG
jgi:hypothetical protein